MSRHDVSTPAIAVSALFDAEAGVSVATSDDLPGLVAEAAGWDELCDTVLIRVSELLELSGSYDQSEIRVRVFAERWAQLPIPAHAVS